MTTDPELRGAGPEPVREAIAAGDPLPGTRGFAGALRTDRGGDVGPALVRDVLGREPLFVEAATASGPDTGVPPPDEWAFDPTVLDDPEPFPAGHVQGLPGDRQDPDGRRRVWTLPDSSPRADPDRALADLGAAIDAALDDLDPTDPVAFSGGVDSGLVASATDGPLYVAGFPGSQDVEAAREAAGLLHRDLHVVEIDHDTLERAVVDVARATGRTNAMDVAIAVPLYLVARRAAADGHDRLAVGQGADELFGGYAKVAGAPEDDRVEADTVRGARDEVLRTLPDQLPRDVLAIRAAGRDGAPTDAPGTTAPRTGVEPVAPLLDDRVVAAALALPSDLLVDGDRRKVALRAVAADRLPDSIADREKKALQYGSLVSRELDRLARQAGFKRRMDGHVGKYVADLVED